MYRYNQLVSGLHIGIKILSKSAFYGGVLLLLVVMMFGDTWFFLNVIVEQTGLYMHYAIAYLGFRTDAFAQLGYGQGHAPDGLGASMKEGVSKFMDGWTIFYWGWWIAWSPFVGSFLARISRGRTIRELLNFSLTVPLMFSIVWFSVFGGAAIQMEWKAHRMHSAGLALYNDPSYFQAGQNGNEAVQFLGTYSGGKYGTVSRRPASLRRPSRWTSPTLAHQAVNAAHTLWMPRRSTAPRPRATRRSWPTRQAASPPVLDRQR